MLRTFQQKDLLPAMRTLFGILCGLFAAALAIVAGYYGYLHSYRLPNAHEFANHFGQLDDYALAAPPHALASLLGGLALAGLAGGGIAAWVARSNRSGAAFVVATLVCLGVIALAALVPFKPWVIVAGLLLPVPLALAGTRLATPRLEV